MSRVAPAWRASSASARRRDPLAGRRERCSGRPPKAGRDAGCRRRPAPGAGARSPAATGRVAGRQLRRVVPGAPGRAEVVPGTGAVPGPAELGVEHHAQPGRGVRVAEADPVDRRGRAVHHVGQRRHRRPPRQGEGAARRRRSRSPTTATGRRDRRTAPARTGHLGQRVASSAFQPIRWRHWWPVSWRSRGRVAEVVPGELDRRHRREAALVPEPDPGPEHRGAETLVGVDQRRWHLDARADGAPPPSSRRRWCRGRASTAPRRGVVRCCTASP